MGLQVKSPTISIPSSNHATKLSTDLETSDYMTAFKDKNFSALKNTPHNQIFESLLKSDGLSASQYNSNIKLIKHFLNNEDFKQAFATERPVAFAALFPKEATAFSNSHIGKYKDLRIELSRNKVDFAFAKKLSDSPNTRFIFENSNSRDLDQRYNELLIEAGKDLSKNISVNRYVCSSPESSSVFSSLTSGGLFNPGNNCWWNTGMQVIANCDHLSELIKAKTSDSDPFVRDFANQLNDILVYLKNRDGETSAYDKTKLDEFLKLYKRLVNSRPLTEKIDLGTFFPFNPGRQYDSAMVLEHVLAILGIDASKDGIKMELKHDADTKTSTTTQTPFVSKIDIHNLDSETSVHDALTRAVEVEGYKFQGSSNGVTALQTRCITQLPAHEFMIRVNRISAMGQKNQLPLKLHRKNGVLGACFKVKAESGENIDIFRPLKSVSIHQGRSGSSGHFVTRNFNETNITKISDSQVSSPKVFNQQDVEEIEHNCNLLVFSAEEPIVIEADRDGQFDLDNAIQT